MSDRLLMRELVKTMRTDDLGPLPSVHNRTSIVNKGRVAIQECVTKLMSEMGLTMSETFLVLSEQMKSLATTCVNVERRIKA